MLKFELPEPMVSMIFQILQKVPYEIAAPIIGELQRQINVQRLPMEDKP